MAWWFLLVLAAVVAGKGHLIPSAFFFAVGVAVCYVVSIARHPRRVCRACDGTGRHRGSMFWWGDRACGKCAGTQRHRRWGAQILHGGSGELTWAERSAADAKKRRGAPR